MTNHQIKWFKSVLNAIKLGSHGKPKFYDEKLEGYSGKKLIATLQNLISCIDPNSLYAEIGVYRGLTLVSVAASSQTRKCVGIDNFSQFDVDHKNKTTVLNHIKRLNLNNVTLVDEDYINALNNFKEKQSSKIGLLFVDGPHDYRNQLLMIQLAMPHLADNAIIVIDDCNYEHVRLATNDLLRINPDLHLIFQAYTPSHPQNSNDYTKHIAGWWNGVNIIVRIKNHVFKLQTIENGNEADRLQMDHLLHAHYYRDHLYVLVDNIYDISHKPFSLKTLHTLSKFINEITRINKNTEAYRNCNVTSHNLPKETYDNL